MSTPSSLRARNIHRVITYPATTRRSTTPAARRAKAASSRRRASGGARRAPCGVARPAGTLGPRRLRRRPAAPPPRAVPRAPAQPLSGALLPEPGQRCEAVNSSPPPPPCAQNPLHPSPSPSACKEPVVYPWMRKVHVSTGECVGTFPLHPGALHQRDLKAWGWGGRGSQLSPL